MKMLELFIETNESQKAFDIKKKLEQAYAEKKYSLAKQLENNLIIERSKTKELVFFNCMKFKVTEHIENGDILKIKVIGSDSVAVTKVDKFQ